MIARDPKRDTALDCVAGALSSEAARTELFRYASNIAEHMPPDSSRGYVIGANIQVNAVTRRELTALAAEAKKGGTILAGFLGVLEWLKGAENVALASAAAAAAFTVGLIAIVGWGTYGMGSTAQEISAGKLGTRVPVKVSLTCAMTCVHAEPTSRRSIANERGAAVNKA